MKHVFKINELRVGKLYKLIDKKPYIPIPIWLAVEPDKNSNYRVLTSNTTVFLVLGTLFHHSGEHHTEILNRIHVLTEDTVGFVISIPEDRFLLVAHTNE